MTFRLRYFDWVLIGGLALLAAASLLSLASSDSELFSRQLIWYVIAFAVIISGSFIDWRWLGSQVWFRYGLYGFSLLLLIISHLQSETIRGTKSWISIGGMQFEPAELAKLSIILILAHFFSRRHVDAWQSKNIFISLAYLIAPAALIITNPDFGAAFILGCLWFGFLLVSGINTKRFLIGAFLVAIMAVVMWASFLKPYQKERITGFIFPQADPLGSNYNVIQSKIAIGSAGLFGKGFGNGTQTRLKFLPEAQTDFLFAAFVEEWGILGGLVVILTFLLVVYRIVNIGIGARDNYFKLISFGGALYLLIHFFVNVGSNLGLVPVAGVTFPFLSYGGSNLLTTGIIISIIEHTRLESSA
ncbi:MAG: FtsW/RodA/SpoVE family cell cycle protein [Patescibacteria group bacterium]